MPMNTPAGRADGSYELPTPDATALEHSGQLAAIVAERIEAAGGAIAFDAFMQQVLYEPGLGYYAGPAVEFGEAGDFVTAPEISPLFGFCLARQAGELIAQGCPAHILEFGAGSGKLCAHILGALPDIESYRILDLGAGLKLRQREYLQARLTAGQFARVEWLATLPDEFEGIVIANEVLDAMPVKRVVRRDRWRELGIGSTGQGFAWREIPATESTQAAMRAIESQLGNLPDGYTTELNPNLGPWFEALAQSCRTAAVLLFDYGYERDQYYHPQRSDGTLSCHYRHRVHFDPLIYPGLQDITAFVDFDAAADAAEAAGFEIRGLVDQRHFLFANGLLELVERQTEDVGDLERLALAQQVKTLTLPEEMGEKFKLLALTRNLAVEMPALRRGSTRG
jgi:SAM-dependent MidA family methyltransferase